MSPKSIVNSNASIAILIGLFFLGCERAFANAFLSAYWCFGICGVWCAMVWLASNAMAVKSGRIVAVRRNAKLRAKLRKDLRRWQIAGSLIIACLTLIPITATRHQQRAFDDGAQRADLAAQKKAAQAELEKTAGSLYPGTLQSPATNSACSISGEQVGLYLGNNIIRTEHFPLIVLKVGNDPLIVIDRNSDGSVALTLDVRSKDGKIIARVVRNRFELNPNNYLSMFRPDHSNLYVQDQYGDEALRVSYLNAHAIFLTGLLYTSGGRLINLEKLPYQYSCLNVGQGPAIFKNLPATALQF